LIQKCDRNGDAYYDGIDTTYVMRQIFDQLHRFSIENDDGLRIRSVIDLTTALYL